MAASAARGLRALAACLLLAAALPAAQAHASRLSCAPEPGARLDEAPREVVVVLTEPIEDEGTTMRVTDQDGRRVDEGDLRVEHGHHPRLTLSLQPDLPAGAYTVSWRVLSKDTHTVSESCGFAVGGFEPPAAGTGDGQDVAPQPLVARSLAYAGLALALGALGLLVVRPGVPAGLPLTLTKAIAVGAALHSIGVAAMMQATAQANALALGEFLATGVGRTMAVRLVAGAAALAVAALAFARPTRAAPLAAGLAMLAAAVAAAAGSHSVAQGVATVAVDALHLVASAAWVGGLVLFVVLLGRRRFTGDDALRFGTRFGTLALACILVLLAAGALLSGVLLGLDALADPAGLVGSPYGRFLAAKVALTLAMLAIAAVNRFVLLAPPATTGLSGALQRGARRIRPGFAPLPASGTRGLRLLVGVEAALGCVVLVLAAALTSISPPAQAAGAAEGALHLHGAGETFQVMLVMEPAPRVGGSSTLTLHIHDLATGEMVRDNSCDATGSRDSCVDVVLGAGDGSSGDRHPALPDGQGAWTVQDVLWTTPGPATALVRVSTAEAFGDEVRLAFTVA